MFTGLIESLGRVARVEQTPTRLILHVGTDLASQLSPGESLAVNGVCLTVTEAAEGTAGFDVSPETARVTTLGRLTSGSLVNLERSLRADARIGGHFVQGHVDATGTIESLRQEGDSRRLTVSVPTELTQYVVQKGSIALDGISLTIASVSSGGLRLDVQIIPFTWQHTNLQAARVRDTVNVECDILGKYVVRALQQRNA
jgi:riboflavin synthase alpha subunit